MWWNNIFSKNQEWVSTKQKESSPQASQETEIAIRKILREAGIQDNAGADVMREIFRFEISVKKWREALELYESVTQPDREPLQTIYIDLEDDSQVQAKSGKIVSELKSLDYQVFNGDTIDENKTKFIQQQWFRNLIEIHYKSSLFGYSLVGMDTTGKEKNWYNPVVIDRRFVYPNYKGGVIMDQTRANKIKIESLGNLVLSFGNKRDKGLFNKIIPYYLYKKQGFTSWATTLRKLGVPIPFIGTDLTNTNNVTKLKEGLANMGSKSYFLVNKEDEINFQGLTAGGRDLVDLFDKITRSGDEAISKIMEGQTMTTDDGSSRSQAEVHERVAKTFFMSLKEEMLIDFNGQLIAKLAADGLFTGTEEIRVIDSVDTETLIGQVEKLSRAGFNIDVEWVEEKTGIKLDQSTPMRTIQNIAAMMRTANENKG